MGAVRQMQPRGVAGEWGCLALVAGLIAGEYCGKGRAPLEGALAALAACILTLARHGAVSFLRRLPWGRGSGLALSGIPRRDGTEVLSESALRCSPWKDGRGSGAVEAAALLAALLLLGWSRGAQAHRDWERAMASLRQVEGLAWVEAAQRDAGGDFQVRAVRRVGEGRVRRCTFPLRPAGYWAPGESAAALREGFARLNASRPARFPGDWSERENLRAEGSAGWLAPILLVPLPADRASHHQRSGRSAFDRARGAWRGVLSDAENLRNAWAGSVARLFDPRGGALAVGLLLGSRADASRGADRGRVLSRAGVGHLLAVSGLHVALFGGCLLAFLRLWRLPRIARAALLCCGLLAYGSLVGWSASVTRAAGVGICWALSDATRRRPKARTLLLVVLAANLWARPAAWRAAGLQLSYVVSLAIIGAHARQPGGRSRCPGGALLRTLVVMLAAQSAAWPLLIGLQGAASPLFVLSNGLLVPLSGLALPVISLALALEALPGYPQELALAPARTFLTAFLFVGDRVAPWCDRCLIPGELGQATALAAAVGIALLWQPRRIPLALRAASALLALLLVVSAARAPIAWPRVVLLDAGQGESWALFWAQETWVIDTGPVPGTEGRGRYCLGSVLRAHGRWRIDRLFLTHDDRDHTGGLAELSETGTPVRVIHHPEHWAVGPATSAWMRSAVRAGSRVIPLARGDTLRAKGGYLAVIHPPRESRAPGSGSPALGYRGDGEDGAGTDSARTDAAKNSRCLGFNLEAPGLRGVLCADAPADTLVAWAREGLVGSVTFASAAHHGSDASLSLEFLARARPEIVLIGVGRDNRFHFPGAGLLAALAARGTRAWRTDREGSLTISPSRAGWTISGYASGRRQLVGRPPACYKAPALQQQSSGNRGTGREGTADGVRIP
jgi:competence protein ComEC